MGSRSGASTLQTATVDRGTPVSGRRARTPLRAGEVGAVSAAAGSADAVQAAAGALVAMAAVAEDAAAVAGGLAAQGAPHRLKLLVVCTPLVPPSLPLLPMSLCDHLSRGWSAVSDVGTRDARVMGFDLCHKYILYLNLYLYFMVSCGVVAYSCCAAHSCSACSLARARRAAPWL